MYKVLFFPPFEKEPKISCFLIEDITTLIIKRRNYEEKNGLYETATFTHDNER